MKKLFLSAALPLAILPGISPSTRVIDPQEDPSRLEASGQLERGFEPIAALRAGRLREIPWSDRAWDHNRALMNERYTDPQFVKLASWPERRAYAARLSTEALVRMPAGPRREKAIASLSPAEKYDLVMGTLRGGLSEANRASLDHDMDESGRFPTWWGICEGSAAASLVSAEPVRAVVVHSTPHGVNVPFYATDIKSLLSLLWSSYNRRLRLPEIGRQCDSSKGGSCFDVNPASFHLALHHFLGLEKGHLIVDVDASPVVWNHPVLGYDTRYYRPDLEPGHFVGDYLEAVIPAHSFGDPRRQLRAAGITYLVGVVTELYYGENRKVIPLHGPVKQEVKSMRLVYELELDKDLRIIGGEWISKAHPDILWTIPDETDPLTPGDLQLGSAAWDGLATPLGWESAARRSAREMMPLKKFVDVLVERSIN